MKAFWKATAQRARISNWPPMAWAVLALILLGTITTVLVGMELFDITAHRARVNTQ